MWDVILAQDRDSRLVAGELHEPIIDSAVDDVAIRNPESVIEAARVFYQVGLADYVAKGRPMIVLEGKDPQSSGFSPEDSRRRERADLISSAFNLCRAVARTHHFDREVMVVKI